jgi:RNA polymerase sigma factor (sigma-70 family)
MNIAFGRTAAAVASPSYATAREPSSDEMLIRRIARGDQLAMRALFARHQTPLYRWLLRIVRDETLAEDLLSDVFLDVWRQAASFEARSSVSTWLMAIARYKALSARRRRTDAPLDDETASTIVDPADNAEIVPNCSAGPWLACRQSTAKSSIWSTTTRNLSKRSQISSASPRPRSRRACSMRARTWPIWSTQHSEDCPQPHDERRKGRFALASPLDACFLH